jgi:GntR family transcriptional regulator
MSDKLFLSNNESTPMYTQIMDQIVAKVMAGDWPPGQPLPSIRELASASRVSVITVKRAYLELERAGVIVTRQGKGSFVADSQDLTRQLAEDEFNLHMAAMLHAATKLGMRERDIVSQVRAALSVDVSSLSREKNSLARK